MKNVKNFIQFVSIEDAGKFLTFLLEGNATDIEVHDDRGNSGCIMFEWNL